MEWGVFFLFIIHAIVLQGVHYGKACVPRCFLFFIVAAMIASEALSMFSNASFPLAHRCLARQLPLRCFTFRSCNHVTFVTLQHFWL